MPDNPIEKIEESEDVSPARGAQEAQPERSPPNKEHFDSLLQNQENPQATTKAVEQVAEKTAPSPMETVQGTSTNATGGLSYEKLLVQTKEAVGKIEEVKNILQTPNIKLKKSDQQILDNKLTHIEESMRIALSRAGLEYNVPEESAPVTSVEGGGAAPARVNPLERFLNMLTNSQNQLENLSTELNVMGKNPDLSPVDMLAIQVKMNQIQQQLELCTSLLNKALEGIKTMLNVQV